jgi:cell division protein FtsB
MQKILLICLLLILFAFNLQLHHGHGGIDEDNQVRDKIKEQLSINKEFAARNQMMLIKIEGLKGSADAIEARARYELNLVKPDETLVKLPPNDVRQSKTTKE